MTTGSSQRPHRGPLDASRLAEAFAPYPDLTLELLAEAASTNAVAAQRAAEGAPEGLVVLADHQAAGRGRLDRTWQTPPGTAVTFSLLLRPGVPAACWPWLPLLVGHNVAKALTALGHEASLKWPNDVLLADGRKVAGILVERVDTPAGPAAIVGVGINVAQEAAELPVDTATSLAIDAAGVAPDRETVLLEAVATVREGYDVWQAGGEQGTERLASSYRAHCATIGRQVRVDLPGGGELLGRAVDIDGSGRLVVQTSEGPRSVGAGDVVHVRPAPDAD
ncbi:biotin--[acetyl-CoA-carboxylase] ligase [Nocardioides sp. zg-536]|uniref:biotin--[biotin carboxyl-carrier protein] ligase n=1 Tax=Nocardioides faecalis TaxID=2803858 RepID=A0A939BXI0_9ACTN|nr:biotin--[acetyl-CoA-carboxylase] ligase [Nocardioides faecalis]MBM9459358.1 biotin--[acetyl-CoA-carboxylase] ligase [Nocardioides faecalis]MBS4751599.1 biotin--[acetyl-CoA-carboxylase] ligase [Nocardioides faecalis]QVI59527.1 biotin--[acetyl-CoA-carboxylase] ligase [Nocardioides faecalis]